MRFHRHVFALISISFLISLFAPVDAGAIPAFARRHKISCSTCHAPVPKLKPFGDEFAGNGFMIPEEEKKRDYVTGGDELMWLNRTFPIAVRFDVYAMFDEGKKVENDLQSPWGVKLLSGGALYKNIGYYFYFYLAERGEVAGVEDAYIHFNNVFGWNLDVMVGQFQTSDPLMKRELRLTFEDYEAYRVRIGDSIVNLTYDRGVMLPLTIDRTATDLIFIVVNGNGIGEAGDFRKFDNDKYKNVAFRLNQGIGDWGSLGGYVYYGQELGGVSDYKNEVTYVGPDLNLSVGPLELTGQYLFRKDTNPGFMAIELEAKTHGTIVELIYSPRGDMSRFFLTALYNGINSDYKGHDYETMTLSGTHVIARNLRFTLEYTYDIEIEASRVVAGLVSAF